MIQATNKTTEDGGNLILVQMHDEWCADVITLLRIAEQALASRLGSISLRETCGLTIKELEGAMGSGKSEPCDVCGRKENVRYDSHGWICKECRDHDIVCNP